mgnify:CR=1 FL=1
MFLFRFRSFVGPAHDILRSAYIRGELLGRFYQSLRKE